MTRRFTTADLDNLQERNQMKPTSRRVPAAAALPHLTDEEEAREAADAPEPHAAASAPEVCL